MIETTLFKLDIPIGDPATFKRLNEEHNHDDTRWYAHKSHGILMMACLLWGNLMPSTDVRRSEGNIASHDVKFSQTLTSPDY